MIRYCTVITTIVIFLYSFASTSIFGANIKNSTWYKSAKRIVKIDEKAWQISANQEGNAFKNIEDRDEALIQFKNCSIPNTNELSTLLDSSLAIDKQIALVTMLSFEIENKRLISKAIKNIVSSDNFFTRLYFYKYFLKIDTDTVKVFKDDYIRLLEKEDNEVIIFYALPILAQINSKEVVPFFCEYLRTGSEDLIKVCRIFIKKIDTEYSNEILKCEGR